VQHELFDLGGELCIPGMAMIEDADIDRLEQCSTASTSRCRR
jgi:cob(I)alamin adenosyltransferase